MKKAFSMILILLVLLSACISMPAQEASNPPLRVTHSLWPGDYPAVLAQKLGLFEKHGVAVQLIPLENYSDLMPLFLSGQVDISLPNWTEAITMHSQKPDLFKVILANDYSDGADQIVALPEIEDVTDLRWKRIGVVPRTFGAMFIRQMLAKSGMMASEVTFVDLGPEAVVENMPDTVDAGYTWEPYTSQARERGYNVIFDSSQTPGLLTDVIIARSDVVRSRPEDVQAFVDAWFEALVYWQTNPEQANALIAEATGQAPEDISLDGIHMYSREENIQAFNPDSGPLSLYDTGEIIVNFLKSVGLISAPIDFDTLLEPAFIQQPAAAQ